MMTLLLSTKSALKNSLLFRFNSALSAESGEITAPMTKALPHAQSQATVSTVDKGPADHYTNNMNWNARLTPTQLFAKHANQKAKSTITTLPAWPYARQLDQLRGLSSLLFNIDSAHITTDLSLTSLAESESKEEYPQTY